MYRYLFLQILILTCLISCTRPINSNHTRYDYKLYLSQNDGKYSELIIVFLGGSEGGFPKLFNPKNYTKYGATCLSIAYFGTEKTVPTLEKIKLEYVYGTIQYVIDSNKMKNKKIVLLGYSKGAELSLILATYNSVIDGVCVINPSSTVFQSPESLENRTMSSSWTFNNKEIPYALLDYDLYRSSEKKHYRELYENALKNEDTFNCSILVENINGPILIITGKDDIVWPAEQMANTMTRRLRNNKYKYWFKHISYVNTGHTINPFYSLGGTLMGNIKSYINMKTQIIEFLDLF